jgi:hypothetical protein
MTNQHSIVSAACGDRDLFRRSQSRERSLNAAIVQAGINEGFEKYLDIFDAFYADDVEVSSDTWDEPIRGKARMRSPLLNFLVPLHVMAEIGGLSVSIRPAEIPGDAAQVTHSVWTLELTGVSGAICTLSWCTIRKWNGPRVVYERHYNHQQSGGPLTFSDLDFSIAKSSVGFRRPS